MYPPFAPHPITLKAPTLSLLVPFHAHLPAAQNESESCKSLSGLGSETVTLRHLYDVSREAALIHLCLKIWHIYVSLHGEKITDVL